jgi:hypothetical protein
VVAVTAQAFGDTSKYVGYVGGPAWICTQIRKLPGYSPTPIVMLMFDDGPDAQAASTRTVQRQRRSACVPFA